MSVLRSLKEISTRNKFSFIKFIFLLCFLSFSLCSHLENDKPGRKRKSGKKDKKGAKTGSTLLDEYDLLTKNPKRHLANFGKRLLHN